MALLNSPNSDEVNQVGPPIVLIPVPFPAEAEDDTPPGGSEQTVWVADQDLLVGGFTGTAVTGDASSGSGDITVQTGASDALRSGDVLIQTTSDVGVVSDVRLDIGFSDQAAPTSIFPTVPPYRYGQAQVFSGDNPTSTDYLGLLASQALGLSGAPVTLDATVIGATTETEFTVADTQSVEFPADFFIVAYNAGSVQRGSSALRYRVFVTTDGTAGANNVTIRVRLSPTATPLSGPILGQSLVTFNPANAADVIVLDGVAHFTRSGIVDGVDRVSASCLSQGGASGTAANMTPYVIEDAVLDSTVALRLVVTVEFSSGANATTARFDSCQVTFYG